MFVPGARKCRTTSRMRHLVACSRKRPAHYCACCCPPFSPAPLSPLRQRPHARQANTVKQYRPYQLCQQRKKKKTPASMKGSRGKVWTRGCCVISLSLRRSEFILYITLKYFLKKLGIIQNCNIFEIERRRYNFDKVLCVLVLDEQSYVI